MITTRLSTAIPLLCPIRSSSLQQSATRARRPVRRFLSTQRRQEVIVVRHGETDWNKEHRVQGFTDIPLNEKGLAQAQASATAVVQYLKQQDCCPSIIYSSPLSRASDTAAAIVKALSQSDNASTPPQLVTHDALKEWNLGVIEGLHRNKATEDFSDDWNILLEWANPYVDVTTTTTPIQQGESMEQLRSRVVNYIESLAIQQQQSTHPIICVSHGGVMGALLRHVMQQQSDGKEQLYERPGNACVSRFSLEVSSATTTPPNGIVWSIESWADTSHLTGDLAPIKADYNKSK